MNTIYTTFEQEVVCNRSCVYSAEYNFSAPMSTSAPDVIGAPGNLLALAGSLDVFLFSIKAQISSTHPTELSCVSECGERSKINKQTRSAHLMQ